MLSGSCLCGAVQYELAVAGEEAKQTVVCHCRPCRKISGGTASLNLTVQAAAFRLVNGHLKSKRHTHMDEGFQFGLSSCSECSSPIYAEPFFDPTAEPGHGVYVIQAGTLDDIEFLQNVPAEEINVKHRLGWVGAVAGARQKQAYA